MLSGQHNASTRADIYQELSIVWGNAEEEQNQSQASFSSAIRRNETTPSKRRRGSDGLTRRGRTDHDPSNALGEGSSTGSHSRSRTVDDEVGGGSYWIPKRSTSQHPLRTSGSLASSSSWTLDHETRPTMRRMLSDSYDPDDSTNQGNGGRREVSVAQDREMLVIVHEVQSKDSLAGIALKYGISLPELRRANQLWTSDSVHLRKVLYIPVDKTRQAKHIRMALIDLAMHATTETSVDANDTATKEPSTTVDHNLPDIGKITLRRIPASQLSYFPPSNHVPHVENGTSTTFQASATLSNGKGSRNRSALPVSFSRSNESSLQGVLDVFSTSFHATANHIRQTSSSLFASGPPVRAPTTLASRLSLESTSGTPSSTSDDMDWEHEMDIVTRANGGSRRRGHTPASSDVRSPRTHVHQVSASLTDLHASPPAAIEERESVELDAGPFSRTGRSPSPPTPHTPTHRRNSSSRSQHVVTPPSNSNSSSASRGRGRRIVPYMESETEAAATEWGSPRGKSIVRTAQLEPSPGMQLPLRPCRRTKSRDS
ncbi:hypothetical protein C8Q80DRAFT_1149307 [Daedaleopsis nitida]|nr:hypothetical protein C8Q80DRAFT_1149307 [Daedaleopsis nitida]